MKTLEAEAGEGAGCHRRRGTCTLFAEDTVGTCYIRSPDAYAGFLQLGVTVLVEFDRRLPTNRG